MKVEYTETPLGIDVEHPRFSWQMQFKGNKPGYKQIAYQLVVSDEAGNVVWNSDKINRDVSLNLEYSGKPLRASTRYYWVVYVWDQTNIRHTAKSWFETGLMNADPKLSAWNGAKWIGGGDKDMVLYPGYLPMFKINYSVQLDKESKSTHAGFVYGANDNRLMDKHKNLYHLQNKKDESYLSVEIDIAPLSLKENGKLNIYRVGYHPDDKKEVPFKTFSIPLSIINDANKYEKHAVILSSNLGYSQIYIDGSEKEKFIGDVNLNPLGRGGDFIAFPVIADIGFSVAEGQNAAFSNLEIRNFRSPSNVLFTEKSANEYQGIFLGSTTNLNVKDGSYKIQGGKTGTFVTANPARNSMPMLRTTFTSQAKIAKARLYVTARGIYDVYLNGDRIGNDYFNPGLTQYNKTHLYQTYDVTKHIHAGNNALGAILAEGWWSGGATYSGEGWNFFGDRQSLLTKLVITYTDGKEDVIVSDPAAWSYFNNGPVVYGSFFQGEVYDASKEALIEGWSTTSYNASRWVPAEEVSLAGHVTPAEANKGMPAVDDYSKARLIGQFGQTVKKIKELSAKSVQEVRPGIFVYDMGQNMVGVPKINLSGMGPGKKIYVRFAEVKYPDLPEYKGNVGMIMLENIRAAMAQDIYITKGGNETIAPRFTFHGYRFVEVTGIEKSLPIEAVKGTVISSIDKLASHYETSNPKVNKLWENITWSTYGNFLSIPTDCPQRNERLGWSGDISVFARTATYLANVPQFLRRHMLAMRNVQRQDGRFTDVAPLGGGFGGVLWGSAALAVAWESYQQYDDKQLLAEHYDAMKSYIKYIRKKNIDPKTNILTQENPTFWGNLGDWLGPEQDKNDNSLLWEAYFIYDLEIMKKVAAVLGKAEDAKEFNELYLQRKKFFNDTYIDKQTKKMIHSGFKQHKVDAKLKQGDLVDTQISYILPLVFDIYQPANKKKAVDNLVTTIVRQNKADNGTVCPPYSLMTGFIGTAWMNKTLSDNGHSDIAYRLLQQTTYPSWLYSVEQGATTIWERLNSYTHTNGFGGNNQMNSFNHYSFGAIGSWMYNYSLGIERDENSPGFKHFILRPEYDPTGKMTYAKGYYESMYGRIESSWQVKNKTCSYRMVVPANTTATVYIPALNQKDITESGKPVAKNKAVKFLRMENGKALYEVVSGVYHFTSK
ncbi:MAG: family 78 glycoside hydrolase catalytic domain [Ferruginibacter sp.]